MSVSLNVITPQGLEPLQFPTKFRSPSEETPFPDWVSPAVLTAAAALSENEALQELGAWVPHAS